MQRGHLLKKVKQMGSDITSLKNEISHKLKKKNESLMSSRWQKN